MTRSDLFFFGGLFFLIGIFLASFISSFLVILFLFILLNLSFLFFKNNKKFWFLGLSFLIFVGFFYFYFDEKKWHRETKVIFDENIEFFGLVVEDPKLTLNYQELIISLKEPFQGRLLVYLPLQPRFHYGDLIKFKGFLQKPKSIAYQKFLLKEKIVGLVYFPEAQLISSHHGSLIKEFLFKIKEKIISVFQKNFPLKEAALISGLTLGVRSEFSQEFQEAMNRSGTTHIVALSGYNITLVAWIAENIFSNFFSQGFSFILTLLTIFSFVVMTGGEASVVRAGIMGFLLLLAKKSDRFYNFRNACLFAALVMVFENPKVLVFDIGFQLSFLALLGIVYLKPAIENFLKIFKKESFLNWRENLLTTFSAQLAVIPILINHFNNFSLTSLLANVLILETVPLAMSLGFIMALVSFFSKILTQILSWFTFVILKFEIFVIELFAKIRIDFPFSFSFLSILVYYLFLIFIIYESRRIRKIS